MHRKINESSGTGVSKSRSCMAVRSLCIRIEKDVVHDDQYGIDYQTT